jgi:cytochrome c551
MRKVFGLMVLMGVVGCSGDDGEAQTRDEIILSLTPDLVAGETGYVDNCSACHAADGSGGVGPNLVGVGADTTVNAMLNPPGGMNDYSNLTDQEIADIAGYVESL